MKKDLKEDRRRLTEILRRLDRTLKEGAEFSSKRQYLSHYRIFLHLISHVKTLQEGLNVDRGFAQIYRRQTSAHSQ